MEIKVCQEKNRYIVDTNGCSISFFIDGNDANSFAAGFASGYRDAMKERGRSER